MTGSASKIFQGYRAIGYVSNNIPGHVRYKKEEDENFRIITCIGKSFNTYSPKLRLLESSHELPENITCLDSDTSHVFTGSGNMVYAWKNGHKQLVHSYHGHEAKIISILAFGHHLVSVGDDSVLIMHEIVSEQVYLRLPFDLNSFKITVLMHPATYTNKILLGSKQGAMKLVNLKTQNVIYEFTGWQSAVKVIEQSPAIDVVGIGLANGQIIIHNLKLDETLISFQQEWGAVVSLSFRTDGPAHLVSTGNVGHIAVWDLEKKRIATQMRDVHDEGIQGCTFILNEPLLVTNSSDNSVKIWMFNDHDETARRLYYREGHSLPVSYISFYDYSGDSFLSSSADGTVRSFSTLSQRLNKNLGTASFNRKLAKSVGVKRDPNKMPPVTDFALSSTRAKDWDDVACLHEASPFVTTWSTNSGCMGKYRLRPDRIKDNRDVTATSVSVTPCGHFCVIGYSDGMLDRFNIQSGIHRKTYGLFSTRKTTQTSIKNGGTEAKEYIGHKGSVTGVTTDGLNQLVISAAEDGFVKIWFFKTGDICAEINLDSPVTRLVHGKDSPLVAFALKDTRVKLIDIHTRKIARIFSRHESDITDMVFSPNGKWFIVSTEDASVRVWDMIKSRLIDWFLMPLPVKSLDFSPNHEFLATSHVDTLGVYLWCNKTLFKTVSLKPLDSNFAPKNLTFPQVVGDIKDDDENLGEEDHKEDDEEEIERKNKRSLDDTEMDVEYSSPEQISEKLITLSLQPSSRWKNLYNIDLIKVRNVNNTH